MGMIRAFLLTLLCIVTLGMTEPVRSPNILERVAMSTALVRINGEGTENSGTCSGWMYSSRELITAGHCTDQLLHADACFYPDFDCKHPVELEFLGADHLRDVALFALPEGVKRSALPIWNGPQYLGDTVRPVGYPYGKFNVTVGVWVRRVPIDKAHPILWDDVSTEWDQVTAPVSPGSSGGALVNSRGELVGMTIGHDVGDITICLPVDVIREGLKHLSMGTGRTTTF